jgi:autophagy-related protein 27
MTPLLIATLLLSSFSLTSAQPTSQCTITLPNRFTYDLCPLLSSPLEVVIEESTPPTLTKSVYTISLLKPLDRDNTLPADLQCDEGTMVCLKVVNTRPDHPLEPPRTLRVVPVAMQEGLRPKAKHASLVGGADVEHGAFPLDFLLLSARVLTIAEAPLQVTFHGGSYISKSQKATFIFHCDKDAAEVCHDFS